MWCLLSSVRHLSSVIVVRCPSCPVVISRKLSQTDPAVTMEYYYEVGIADFVAAFRPCLRRCPGELFGFKIQNMCKYYYNLLFDLASDHSCCKQNTTVVSPPLWSPVVNKVRRPQSVVHNRRTLRWRRQNRTKIGPASIRSMRNSCLKMYLVSFIHSSVHKICKRKISVR